MIFHDANIVSTKDKSHPGTICQLRIESDMFSTSKDNNSEMKGLSHTPALHVSPR